MKQRLNELEKKNQRLFDLLFRHQVYLEGLKAGMSSDYEKTLKVLYASFAAFLNSARYSTLDEYTRLEFNSFLRQFQIEQSHVFNRYTKRLIEAMKSFLAVDVDIARIIHADVTEDKQFANEGEMLAFMTDSGTDQKDKELWNAITAEPIPANGMMLEDQVQKFNEATSAAVINTLRQGYANGWTPQQAKTAFIGTKDNRFTDGLLSKFIVQNRAMIATALQFLSAGVQADVFTATYERYQWVSVMDNKTTLICRARNGVIYIIGKGPLPPAHYHCRSKTVWFVGTPVPIPETFVAWLKQQPDMFQADILGAEKFANLKAGILNESDFVSISTLKPLSLSEFATKIKYILEN